MNGNLSSSKITFQDVFGGKMPLPYAGIFEKTCPALLDDILRAYPYFEEPPGRTKGIYLINGILGADDWWATRHHPVSETPREQQVGPLRTGICLGVEQRMTTRWNGRSNQNTQACRQKYAH